LWGQGKVRSRKSNKQKKVNDNAQDYGGKANQKKNNGGERGYPAVRRLTLGIRKEGKWGRKQYLKRFGKNKKETRHMFQNSFLSPKKRTFHRKTAAPKNSGSRRYKKKAETPFSEWRP